jgi:sulfopyruvate decarboxylase subunit beta
VVAPYLEDRVVVSNLGWPSKELYALKHQPSNFYMLGSMGMATPIGLGISLSSKKDVVVIDGDGSLLMNPGVLATAAHVSPDNLTILAIDNSSYGSTGSQETLTGSCVDLELVARGFGIGNTKRAATQEQLKSAMTEKKSGMKFIHALALPGNRDVPNIPIDHRAIRDHVMQFLKK